mgnify:FL=1
MSRFTCFFLFFLLSCAVDNGFENFGEKKMCDAIKIRVRACTGLDVNHWGGCDAVDQSIAWESDCAQVRWKLELGKLEN